MKKDGATNLKICSAIFLKMYEITTWNQLKTCIDSVRKIDQNWKDHLRPSNSKSESHSEKRRTQFHSLGNTSSSDMWFRLITLPNWNYTAGKRRSTVIAVLREKELGRQCCLEAVLKSFVNVGSCSGKLLVAQVPQTNSQDLRWSSSISAA